MANGSTVTQIGGSGAQPDLPVFYVNPPNEPPNVFAAFMSNFLAARNPWALDILRRRLDAMDPTAKARLLLEEQELANRRRASELNALNVARQAGVTELKARLQAAVDVRGQDTDASIENAKLASQERIKGTTLQSDQGKALVRDAQKEIRAALQTDSDEELTSAIGRANALLTESEGTLDPGERAAVERQLRTFINQNAPDAGAEEFLKDQLNFGAELPLPERRQAGARSVADILATVPEVPRAQGGSVSRRTERRQPIDAVPPGPTMAERIGAGFTDAGPARDADGLTPVERALLEGQQKLGEIGDPIFRRDRSERAAQAFEALGPEGRADVLQAAEAVGDEPRLRRLLPGRRLRREIEDVQTETEGRREELGQQPLAVQGTPLGVQAEAALPPPEQPTIEQALVDRAFQRGEGSLDDVIESRLPPEDVARQEEDERLRRLLRAGRGR